MRLLVQLARILVGVLFIFSGLVKANDPLGLSYKMQEFFEVWHLSGFDGFTLTMSIAMNAFEIIAGFALLLGWRIRLFSWLLLLLIIFFTFLTGYTFVTGKPVNCGCFGDCLLISSRASFLKDVALLLLILLIMAGQRFIRPLLGKTASWIAMLVVVLFSFGFQWYTLKYQPVVDCLPFKKGNNITEKMQIPAGAISDSFAIRFVYEKGGKQFEFDPSGLPADLDTYNYVSRTDKLVRQGNATAPIHGFALTGISGEDSTAVVLQQAEAVVLFIENLDAAGNHWWSDFASVYKTATDQQIPVYAIVPSKERAAALFAGQPFANVQLFSCDNTTIRTAARTNPMLYLLRQGTVIQKEGARRFGRILATIKQP